MDARPETPSITQPLAQHLTPPPTQPPTQPLALRPPARRSIDCGECVMAGTHACDDCVVTFIVRREPGDAVVIDAAEERALRALGDGGLVPQLRHRSRTG